MVKDYLLGDISGVEIIGGQITSRVEGKNEMEIKNKVRILNPKAFGREFVNYNELTVLNVKTDLDEKKITHEGDIVVKLSTPYDAYLITKKDIGLLVPSFCAIIRTDDSVVTKEYLVALINSKYFMSQNCDINSRTGMGMISTGVLRKSLIPVPTLNVQKKFGQKYVKLLEKERIFKRIIELEYEKIDSSLYEMKEV